MDQTVIEFTGQNSTNEHVEVEDNQYKTFDSKSKIENEHKIFIDGEIIDGEIMANVVKMYKCTVCDFISDSILLFVQHYKSHFKNKSEENEKEETTTLEESKQMFLCGQCYSIFNTMDLCKDHMIKDHNFQKIIPTKELENTSSDDDDEFDDTNIAENIKKEEWLKPIPLRELKPKLTQSFIYRCSIKGCVYKFETEENRDKHLKCHISLEFNKVRNFKCCECGLEHKLWRDCTKHMWKTHKIDIDLLKCPVCDYKNLTSVQIFRHLQIHGKTKGYVCSVCSMKFRQASQLRYHSVTHLDTERRNSNENRWYTQKKCEICGHLFANSKTLSKHIKVVHNKIKPFICNVCGYKSARKSTWMIHSFQHTNEKPYQCKYCNYSARDPSSHKKHENRHITKIQYKCKFCEYGCVQSTGLKNHMKRAHSKIYEIKMKCDKCQFNSVNEDVLKSHIEDHNLGLIPEDDSNEAADTSPKNLLKRPRNHPDKLNIEISSDCFLPLESTDSMNHDPPLDTGGVTIPANSEDTQFSNFMCS